MAFEAANYEAEDVFTESDNVDLFPLEPGAGFRFREKCQRRLLWKDVTRTLASVNPGLRPVRLRKEYDLFFCRFQTLRDVLYVNADAGLEGSVQDKRMLAGRIVLRRGGP